MAKGAYIGVGGVARKVKQPLIGVDGVARKVKSGYVGVNSVARQFLQGGILASTLSVGSSVYLMENGSAVEYLVVNQGKPQSSDNYKDSCNGTWLLRKDVFETRQWNSANNVNYPSASIHSYLNSTFLNRFDTKTQNAIQQAVIPYDYDAYGSTGNDLSAKVFLLSLREIGVYSSNSGNPSKAGLKLEYFSDTPTNALSTSSKRIAYLNGVATAWWTRSLYSSNSAWCVWTNGSMGGFTEISAYGIRPALILNSTALVDPSTMQLIG